MQALRGTLARAALLGHHTPLHLAQARFNGAATVLRTFSSGGARPAVTMLSEDEEVRPHPTASPLRAPVRRTVTHAGGMGA